MSFAAAILSHRSLRRRHFVGLILFFALLFWGLVWGVAAYRFNKIVDTWVAISQENGNILAFSERATGGTPWAIHITLDQFQAHYNKVHSLSADKAILRLNLWDWGNFSIKLRDNVHGQLAGLSFTADIFKFGFMKPSSAPLDENETGLYVWVQSFGLIPQKQSPLALGNRIEELSFDARVMGTPPDFSKTGTVKAWNDASGVIEFDDLDLRWGSMELVAKGTMALTADLQPEGAFSGRVDGLEEAVDKFTSQGELTRKDEALLRSSLSVLARPSGMVGGTSPIVPLSLQNGGVFLGPVRIATLPKLVWPQSNP
ncbi:MAG: DUF2125 domain-containing protein [Bdellovibrionales bacterium]|jgi:hypothetical protein